MAQHIFLSDHLLPIAYSLNEILYSKTSFFIEWAKVLPPNFDTFYNIITFRIIFAFLIQQYFSKIVCLYLIIVKFPQRFSRW